MSVFDSETSQNIWNFINFDKYAEFFGKLDIKNNVYSWTSKVRAYIQKILQKYENEIIIEKEDLLLLKFCNVSYLDPDKRPKILDWYDIHDEEECNNSTYVIYTSDIDKTIIIAYKWTDLKNVRDIISDLETALWVNAIDVRLTKALEGYDFIRSKYPDYKIHICGHSLWWTIWYIVMKHRMSDRCAVFNPWSVPNKLFLNMTEATLAHEQWTRNVYTYRVLWDPVSLFSYVWHTKIFRIWEIDPLKLHALEIFSKK